MKCIKLLLAVAIAVALTATAGFSGEKVITDNDGNKWIIDTETAATPGAGSGEGAIVGAVNDTLASYQKHRFDLHFGLNLVGTAGDDSAGTEAALLGFTVFHRPSDGFRWGLSMMRSTAGSTDRLDFGIPAGLKIAPDPWSKYIFWVDIDVLPHFIVLTNPENMDEPRESAWTWAPAIGFKAQVPLGGFALEGGLGAAFPFSIEGVTEQNVDPQVEQLAFGAQVEAVYRIR